MTAQSNGIMQQTAHLRNGRVFKEDQFMNAIPPASAQSRATIEWLRCQNYVHYIFSSAIWSNADDTSHSFQRGRKAEVVVFKTANDRGWGVRTHTPIKAWTFVMEYLGKVISPASAQKGEPTYQFELDFNVDQEAKFVVDAISYGNASHFINHSVR